MNALTLNRWSSLWGQISAASDPQPVYQELVSLYSEPQRHYHNLTHIAECLAEFDSARSLAKDPVAVELAIWFHDAIYDSHASDNEEQSAKLAGERIGQAGGSPALCESVAALVLATKAHELGLRPDTGLLMDVDLSILGQGEERFQAFESQIRKEFEWVPATTFSVKRAEILAGFLSRERIYTTKPFFSKYEKRARSNLRASIRRLKTGV